MNGWIKLHRKMLDWEWFDDSKTVHLFLYLLLQANHKPKRWRGKTIATGQVLTSLSKISIETKLSVRSIRTCLERLKSTSEVTIKSTNRNSIITICKYDDYQTEIESTDKQNDTQADNQTTNKRQTNDKPSNKNDKNDKNERSKEKVQKETFKIPEEEEIQDYLIEKFPDASLDEIKTTAENFLDHYHSNGWMVGRVKMKDWRRTANKWMRNNNFKPKQNNRDEFDKQFDTLFGK